MAARGRGGHSGCRRRLFGDGRLVAEGPQNGGDGCVSTGNAKGERQYDRKKES